MTEETKKVTLTIDETTKVGTIVIDNPPVNVLNAEVFRQLKECLSEADRAVDESRLKAIVLTAKGDQVFIAGADVNEIKDSAEADIQQMIHEGHEICLSIESFRVPIIAAISGKCFGGGTELSLACHMRIITANSMISLPESNLGIMPGLGGCVRMTHMLGAAKAAELILTGEPIDANTAKELKLVNKVVPAGKHVVEATTLAKRIAAKSMQSIQGILYTIHASTLPMPIEHKLSIEQVFFVRCKLSDDGQEGISAFLAKRKAKFNDKVISDEEEQSEPERSPIINPFEIGV